MLIAIVGSIFGLHALGLSGRLVATLLIGGFLLSAVWKSRSRGRRITVMVALVSVTAFSLFTLSDFLGLWGSLAATLAGVGILLAGFRFLRSPPRTPGGTGGTTGGLTPA